MEEQQSDNDLFVIDGGNGITSTITGSLGVDKDDYDDDDDIKEDNDNNNDTWKDDDFLSFVDKGKKTTQVPDQTTKQQGGGGGDGGLTKKAATSTKKEDDERNHQALLDCKNMYANNNSNGSGGGGSNSTNEGLIPIISSQTNSVPPWMQCHPDIRYRGRPVAPLIKLHNEIIDFAKLVMPQDYEIETRDELVQQVRDIAEATFGASNIDVCVFGSQATKLFLPTSDIDMVINFKTKATSTEEKKASKAEDIHNDVSKDPEDTKAKEAREMEEWAIGDITPVGSPLRRLADALQETWKSELTYLEVLENTRIPIVKFKHGPTELLVDVSFDMESGPQAAVVMDRFVQQMPPLRPLIFVLKYFMKIRELNEPYTGGMGSYMLQMMIVSFLQHRAREEYCNYKRSIVMNLGSLLLEFFELYGLDFNYFTTGLSVREDGSYFAKGARARREVFFQPARPTSLALENPLDPTADVGRSTFRMGQIQRSFEVAFRVLLAHVSVPYTPAVSILASIAPPTDELSTRAILIQEQQQSSMSSGDEHDKNEEEGISGNSSRSKNDRKRGRKRHLSHSSPSDRGYSDEDRGRKSKKRHKDRKAKKHSYRYR